MAKAGRNAGGRKEAIPDLAFLELCRVLNVWTGGLGPLNRPSKSHLEDRKTSHPTQHGMLGAYATHSQQK